MTIYHYHHIIPRHMGGTDDPSNLVRLTVEEHAEAHKKLYEEHGKIEDLWAFQLLNNQLSYHDGMEMLLIKNAYETHEKCKKNKTGFFSSEQQSKNGKKGGKALVESGKNHLMDDRNPNNTKVSCLHCRRVFGFPQFVIHDKAVQKM